MRSPDGVIEWGGGWVARGCQATGATAPALSGPCDPPWRGAWGAGAQDRRPPVARTERRTNLLVPAYAPINELNASNTRYFWSAPFHRVNSGRDGSGANRPIFLHQLLSNGRFGSPLSGHPLLPVLVPSKANGYALLRFRYVMSHPLTRSKTKRKRRRPMRQTAHSFLANVDDWPVGAAGERTPDDQSARHFGPDDYVSPLLGRARGPEQRSAGQA